MCTLFGGWGELKRNFLAARQDFVVRVRDMARRKNLTIYALVNETLEQLLRAEEIGVPLSEIVDWYFLVKVAREGGFTLTSESLLFYVLEKVFKEENDSLADMFYETGEWLGKYCLVRFTGEDPIRVFEKIVRGLFYEISEFGISKNSDEILVQCIGSRLTGSYTTLLSVFLEGVMHAFDYSVVNKDVSRGIIALTFKPGNGVE